MVSFLEAGPDAAQIGFDAGWVVTFLKAGADRLPTEEGAFTVSRRHYDGEVRVEGDTTFRASTFELTVHGMLDDDWVKLASGGYRFARIALGWRDVGSGLAAAAAGLASTSSGGALGTTADETLTEVITGRIRRAERIHGDVVYSVRVQGVDARFHQLQVTRRAALDGVAAGAAAIEYARAVWNGAGLEGEVVGHPSDAAVQGLDGPFELSAELTAAEALAALARAAHRGGNGQAQLFLRRDGLHFGPWRAPVAASGGTHALTAESGLVEARPAADTPEQPDEASDPFARPDPVGLRVDVILLGRVDIDVGDEVTLVIDLPAAASLTSLASSVIGPIGDIASGVVDAFGAAGPAGEPQSFRVLSVTQEVSRTSGFVTRLRIEGQSAAEEPEARPGPTTAARSGSDAHWIAATLEARMERDRRARRTLDVGEVNAQTTEDAVENGVMRRPQRIDVQEGLDDADAGPANQAVVARRRAEGYTQLFNKPYLTPFAFGRTGLVVPHYPGMRVVTLRYGQEAKDAMVAGCLWPDGTEPVSQPGDWWLSLPTNVSKTESVADAADADPPSGKATHDLVSVKGSRSILVKSLHVGVGENELKDVGQRPDEPAESELVISHPAGEAKIRIDAEGNIEISTTKNLTLKAHKITLDVTEKAEVV